MTGVFDLNETVVERHKAFARFFTDIRSPELNNKVDKLYATKRFWPEPLIQSNPHYADGSSIKDFIEAGDSMRVHRNFLSGRPSRTSWA